MTAKKILELVAATVFILGPFMFGFGLGMSKTNAIEDRPQSYYVSFNVTQCEMLTEILTKTTGE